MKKLVTILALTTTVIASPAFAQNHARPVDRAPWHAQSSDEVQFDGQRGQDPDANVRREMLRDAESGNINH